MYTVEEAATKLNVSKVTIYSKLKIYSDMVIIKQGKRYIDEELLNLIKDTLKSKNDLNYDENSSEFENSENVDVSNDSEYLTNLNSELISTLIEQLKEKDKQIDHLMKLNENNQVLLKEQQSKDLKLLQDHFNEVDNKLIQIREDMSKKKPSKRGIKGLFSK